MSGYKWGNSTHEIICFGIKNNRWIKKLKCVIKISNKETCENIRNSWIWLGNAMESKALGCSPWIYLPLLTLLLELNRLKLLWLLFLYFLKSPLYFMTTNWKTSTLNEEHVRGEENMTKWNSLKTEHDRKIFFISCEFKMSLTSLLPAPLNKVYDRDDEKTVVKGKNVKISRNFFD